MTEQAGVRAPNKCIRTPDFEAKRMSKRRLNQKEIDDGIKWLREKYGPKEIGSYEDNGVIVKVYEGR